MHHFLRKRRSLLLAQDVLLADAALVAGPRSTVWSAAHTSPGAGRSNATEPLGTVSSIADLPTYPVLVIV